MSQTLCRWVGIDGSGRPVTVAGTEAEARVVPGPRPVVATVRLLLEGDDLQRVLEGIEDVLEDARAVDDAQRDAELDEEEAMERGAAAWVACWGVGLA